MIAPFNGWNYHVSNNAQRSEDPISSASANVQREAHSAINQPVGMIGELAGIGAGYAVLVYLGIPSGIVTFFFPPLGIVMCGLTIWLAVRARRRVSRATQRGVDVVSAQLARFLAEFRSYESKWGTWTSPSADGPSHGFGGSQSRENSENQESMHDDSRNFNRESANRTPSAYEILSVREGASPEEVRSAFHTLMLAVHPDRHMNKSPEERVRMEDRTKVITEAYNALKT